MIFSPWIFGVSLVDNPTMPPKPRETPTWTFRWPPRKRERMRRLADQLGMTLTDAVLEATDDWCHKAESEIRRRSS